MAPHLRLAPFRPHEGPPELHGAARVGVRPGTELIHTLAATGERPLAFRVSGLPAGLSVDPETGIVRGTAPAAPGTHPVHVAVGNRLGATSATVELVVGDALALTPPLGWNSWNVYGETVSAGVVARIADGMVASGMRDAGYAYLNLDDFWHAPARAADGRPLAHPERFPDGIAALAEEVHARGLKLGIYSDAGHLTCGGCYGGYGHEAIDAETYASWGVDLLKYDYCHAPVSREAAVARYRTMADALAGCGRSIVFNVCEWGLRRPWEWAPELGAAYWRTTPDIFDSFSYTFWGVRGIARRNQALAEYAGPGRWNDPDMLVVGNRGRGRVASNLPVGRPLHLPFSVHLRGLDDRQSHTHLSLWAMMAAPLLASSDPTELSDVDRDILLNPEVLAIDQDPLGQQGRVVTRRRGVWVMRKPLASGGAAISFSNVSPFRARRRLSLASLGLAGRPDVRDAWARESLGPLDHLEVDLARHESRVFVVAPPAGG
ncbi:MAG: alpha-galactosidase [Actinobacteria bacterium]|nr:alpha-galactosidase [Actinomycetota bacterium]